MEYIQFIIPKDGIRKTRRALTLSIMATWSKLYEIELEAKVYGYQIDYYFPTPESLTFFLLHPPELGAKYNVIRSVHTTN